MTFHYNNLELCKISEKEITAESFHRYESLIKIN